MDISAPLIRDRNGAKKRCMSSIPKIPNSEDAWTNYIGLTWFTCVVVFTFLGLAPGRVEQWETMGELITSISRTDAQMMLMVAAWTIVSMACVHSALDKKFDVWVYLAVSITTFVSELIGTLSVMARNGVGRAVWCIILGTVARVIIRKERSGIMSPEFFIKISIVLLALDLHSVVNIGIKGLFVAWVETIIILIGLYLGATRIAGMDRDSAIVTCCGLSICGSSAVVAIGSAINVSDDIRNTIISIMAVFTIPVIVALPQIGRAVGFESDVIGAWIGGCVDSTGGVAASASLGGPEMLRVAVVVKMAQNLLIGPVALVISSIWSGTVSVELLWSKFPKFVGGFLITSIIITVLPDPLRAVAAHNSFAISEYFAAISFVLIGYDVNPFSKNIRSHMSILILYLIGQFGVDIFTTLGAAYLMFETVP